MNYKNLVVAEKYKDKNGEEKTKWNTVGIQIETDKGAFQKLFMFPGLIINVFEPKKREEEF